MRCIPNPFRHEAAAPHDATVPDRLRAWLVALRAGPAVQVGALELTPLLHGLDGLPTEPALLLHEALAAGGLEVVEQGGGSVNQVVARNAGKRAVLVLEGECIVGAKQNRVVTLDVLIAPGETVAIPVGCVEQGRWGHGSGKFSASGTPVEPAIRAKTVHEVSARGGLDQARLWSDVSAKLKRCGVTSGTSDYHAFVRRDLDEAARQAKAVPVLPGQTGVIALCDGRLAGFDVVGHPLHWRALAERLIASYVLSGAGQVAVPAGGAAALPAGRGAEGWLRAITGARFEARPALALGTQVALAGGGLAGSGLWHGDAPAHLAVFGTDESGGPETHPHVAPNARWTAVHQQ